MRDLRGVDARQVPSFSDLTSEAGTYASSRQHRRTEPSRASHESPISGGDAGGKPPKPSRTAGMTAIPASPAPRQLPTTGCAAKRGEAV
jgi:hypothetical protein